LVYLKINFKTKENKKKLLRREYVHFPGIYNPQNIKKKKKKETTTKTRIPIEFKNKLQL
jgi:hypothetical protein